MAIDRLRQQFAELQARRYVRVGTVEGVNADGTALDVLFPDGRGGEFVVPGIIRFSHMVAPQVYEPLAKPEIGDPVAVLFPRGTTDSQGYYVADLRARRYVRVGTVDRISSNTLDVEFPDGAGGTFTVTGVVRVGLALSFQINPNTGDTVLVHFPDGRPDGSAYTEA